MKSGDITTHRGKKVILGPEFNPGQGPASCTRGRKGEKWYRYLVIELGAGWASQGAAPLSEFGKDVSKKEFVVTRDCCVGGGHCLDCRNKNGKVRVVQFGPTDEHTANKVANNWRNYNATVEKEILS